MRIPKGRTSIVFILLIASSCTGARDSAELVTRSLGADGVLEVVSHAPEPLPAPWVLEPDLVIGVEYGDDAYMLRRPTAFTVLEDGTHVILDSSPSQVRIYDAQGDFITEFGRPGSGPTDLPRTMYFNYATPVAADRFDLWGRYRSRRVQRWSVTGDLLSLRDAPKGLGGGYTIHHWDGSHFYVGLNQERSPDTASPVLLVRSDPAATSTDTLYYLDMKRVPIACFMIEAEMGWGILGSPLVTPDQRLCVTAPYEDWVHVIDLISGRESLRFRWDHVADSVSDTLIAKYKGETALEQDMEAGARWLHENLSAVGLAAAPNGEIWVQRSPERLQYGIWTMDVFAHDGVYRGRLQVPCSPETLRPYHGYLYGLGLIDGDAPALIRYRLLPVEDES